MAIHFEYTLYDIKNYMPLKTSKLKAQICIFLKIAFITCIPLEGNLPLKPVI